MPSKGAKAGALVLVFMVCIQLIVYRHAVFHCPVPAAIQRVTTSHLVRSDPPAASPSSSGTPSMSITLPMSSTPSPTASMGHRRSANYLPAQRLHGAHWGTTIEGALGVPTIPYKSAEEETRADKHRAHNPHHFNLPRSKAIPLSRNQLSVVHPNCSHVLYDYAELPHTSVIFVFHKEAFSTLVRSIHSVLNTADPDLLEAIILVDDFSETEELGHPLEDYIEQYLPPKVRLLRMPERSGLMRARMAGIAEATTSTIVVLDSHIECTPGWLEPLLDRIRGDRRRIVMPKIDTIDADTFEFLTTSGIDILGFSWALTQASPSRETDPSSNMPHHTPIMAGGLFAMDRELFYELGGYDSEMRGWGGEEVELSIKAWLCGSTLEVLPCSHVGHIFRSQGFWDGETYTVGSEDPVRNRLRTAKIWMGEYAQYVVDVVDPERSIAIGDTSKMEQIRDQLECQPFSWFLETVYPEMFVPRPENVRHQGSLRSKAKEMCLDSLQNLRDESIGINWCHYKSSQYVLLTYEHQIRFALSGFDCADHGEGHLIRKPCSGSLEQLMIFDDSTGLVRMEEDFTSSTNLCMAVISANTPARFGLAWRPCNPKDKYQGWEWTNSPT